MPSCRTLSRGLLGCCMCALCLPAEGRATRSPQQALSFSSANGEALGTY